MFVVSSGTRLHREDVRCILRKPDCTEVLFFVSSGNQIAPRCSLCPQETRLHWGDVLCVLKKPDCPQKMFVVSSVNQIAPRRCSLCLQETRLHREDLLCVLRKPNCTEKVFVVSSGNQIAPRRCSLWPKKSQRGVVRCVSFQALFHRGVFLHVPKNPTTPRCCNLYNVHLSSGTFSRRFF